ncbi:MAG: TolC family protein [Propionivibrio sp.]
MRPISAAVPRATFALPLILASLLAGTAQAFDATDPFGTEAITPAPPRLAPSAETHFIPCKPVETTHRYGVLDVVDRALCANPKTREAWANARVQAAQVGVAQSDFLPDLDGRIGVSRSTGSADASTQNSASLTLAWLLYDFGARAANLENARQLLNAAAHTFDATVQTVFLDALRAYYATQAARAAVAAAEESERASRESLAAAEVRYKVGTGTPADRLQAQTAWSQATLTRIKAEGILRSAYGALANVMGEDASRPLVLEDIPKIPADARRAGDVEALIQEARLRRPELKAAEARVGAARANVDQARAAGKPSLALGAGSSWQGTDMHSNDFNTRSNSIGLTLSIPLFSGFETTYNVRTAEARFEAASALRDNVNLQVALDVWTAYQDLATSGQTLSASADLLASAEQSERVALGRYKAGVGNILDLLNAQSALAAARLQRIQAALDWHVARAALARAIGTLDGSLLDPTMPATPTESSP